MDPDPNERNRMAWLYRQAESENWWIGFRAGRKQVRRSTGTSDQQEAEKQLASIRAMHEAHRAGLPLDEFYALLTGAQAQPLPLLEAVNGWLAECQGANSPGTVRVYRSIAESFMGFLGATESGPALGAITSDDVLAFLTSYRKTRSASTTNRNRKILSAFFLREVKQGRLKANPVLAVKPFKAGALEQSGRRAFTVKEIKAMYRKAPSPFWKYSILAGFYTGLRLGDLVCLRWAAVDFSAGFIRTLMQKTNKTVAVPMAAPVREMLQALHAKAGNPKPTAFIWPEQAKLYQERGAGPFSNEFYDEVLLPLGMVSKREVPGRTGRRAPAPAGRAPGRQPAQASIASAIPLCPCSSCPAAVRQSPRNWPGMVPILFRNSTRTCQNRHWRRRSTNCRP